MQMKIFNFLSKIDTGKNIDLVFLLVILTAFPYYQSQSVSRKISSRLTIEIPFQKNQNSIKKIPHQFPLQLQRSTDALQNRCS